MYAFGLPVWVLFGLLVILGADQVWRIGSSGRIALAGLTPTVLLTPLLYAAIAKWGYIPPEAYDRERAGFWQRYFDLFDYVANVWEPARYFANPNKHGYDAADHAADRVFERLPPGAHLFDDDGKGYYPLGLYHQRVLNRRRDIVFHQIFGPFLSHAEIESHARDLRSLLARGQSVFISSPYWPERPVLNRLYEMFMAETGARGTHVGSMTPKDLEHAFPGYRLERVPISDREPLFIYEFVPTNRPRSP
jgi:hypothetical protein